jgi:hypothetical protein
MPTLSIWPSCQQTCYCHATISLPPFHRRCCVTRGVLDKEDNAIENAVLLLLCKRNDWYGTHFAVATVPALILHDIFGCRMIHSAKHFLPFRRIKRWKKKWQNFGAEQYFLKSFYMCAFVTSQEGLIQT